MITTVAANINIYINKSSEFQFKQLNRILEKGMKMEAEMQEHTKI